MLSFFASVSQYIVLQQTKIKQKSPNFIQSVKSCSQNSTSILLFKSFQTVTTLMMHTKPEICLEMFPFMQCDSSKRNICLKRHSGNRFECSGYNRNRRQQQVESFWELFVIITQLLTQNKNASVDLSWQLQYINGGNSVTALFPSDRK